MSSFLSSTLWQKIVSGIGYAGGFVGIGTTAPTLLLDVVGSGLMLRLSGSNPAMSWKDTAGAADTKNWDLFASGGSINFRALNDAYTAAFPFLYVGRTGYTIADIAYYTGSGSERFRISAGGNVGVGTQAPSSLLHVAGAIRAQSYTVATLPSAASNGAGAMAFVSDATATLAAGLGATVVGGGANFVPVYSDGTNWKVG